MQQKSHIFRKLRHSVASKPQFHFLVKSYKSLLNVKSYLIYASRRKPISISKNTIQEYNRTRTAPQLKYICHAPFTNLFFGYDGKIGVCCYNRLNILGTYPETGIIDAWNGDILKELRSKIKRYDFSGGCYCCQVQLVEKAYNTILARNYDYFVPDIRYPKSMEFELSNRCNLECIMCNEENSSAIAIKKTGQQPKLLPYDDNFIEQLRPFIPYLRSTKFMGGEPLLIPIYYKIWELIIEINPSCEIVIQTNGTVLNDKIKDLLEKGNFSISISIDSIVKETYESIRVNADYNKVMSNLEYFIDLENAKIVLLELYVALFSKIGKKYPIL